MQFSSYEDFSPKPFTATQAELEAFVRARAEEAILKARAEVEKEEAFLEAKAEEASFIVKAGCGSKRKAEEDREEAPAAFTVKAKAEAAFTVKAKVEAAIIKFKAGEAIIKAKADATSDSEVEDSDDDCPYDSGDDTDTAYAKIAARYEQRVRERDARNPWLTYDSAADILERHGEDSAFYNRQQEEDSHAVVDGVAPVVSV